ncbi:related to glucosamine-6-phosphate isomerase [Cephalotrichum gorgonifer]|uniref:Glucosamine-6-phosphate isomerase n=1 Tax=Cephalotrichum gorgonifer TaxID=2041049 RepID=A0AAE8SXE4_9PEZI|nr:related to glucosamine-6-phosphate isomerase [Cephalotrichum gorgonifer]
MRVIIREEADAASEYVANYIVERIRQFAPTPEKPFVLGLPTGSSPLGVYKCLVKQYKEGKISFENVVTFNMDEYVGLPRDHPESYHTFMWNNLFSHINIHPSNAHIPNGNAENILDECARYEALMRSVGGVDLFMAGVGVDGHVAFNEPGSSLSSRTRIKTLTHDTRVANSRFFGGDVEQVPRTAVTVGVGTVLEAREVVAIVLGRSKAVALQRCVEGAVSHMWTLSCLQLHPNAMIVCDDDATLEMQVKTVRYFKSIEATSGLQPLHPAPPTLPQETLPSPNSKTPPYPTIPSTVLNEAGSGVPILQPISSRLRIPDGGSAPSTSTNRSPSPECDLVPDRMASRIPGGGFAGRLSPAPDAMRSEVKA